jgi:hypothetical protein
MTVRDRRGPGAALARSFIERFARARLALAS